MKFILLEKCTHVLAKNSKDQYAFTLHLSILIYLYYDNVSHLLAFPHFGLMESVMIPPPLQLGIHTITQTLLDIIIGTRVRTLNLQDIEASSYQLIMTMNGCPKECKHKVHLSVNMHQPRIQVSVASVIKGILLGYKDSVYHMKIIYFLNKIRVHSLATVLMVPFDLKLTLKFKCAL